MNIEQARFNMIEQQIRPWEVLDQGVLVAARGRQARGLRARRRTARWRSSTPRCRCRTARAMLAPKVEARLLQELAVQRHERVLEIGAGSGYMAALLAHKAQHVTTVEIDPELARLASENLKRAGVLNATRGRGRRRRAGLAVDGPFDVIVLSGSVAEVPRALLGAAQGRRPADRDRRPAADHARGPGARAATTPASRRSSCSTPSRRAWSASRAEPLHLLKPLRRDRAQPVAADAVVATGLARADPSHRPHVPTRVRSPGNLAGGLARHGRRRACLSARRRQPRRTSHPGEPACPSRPASRGRNAGRADRRRLAHARARPRWLSRSPRRRRARAILLELYEAAHNYDATYLAARALADSAQLPRRADARAEPAERVALGDRRPRSRQQPDRRLELRQQHAQRLAERPPAALQPRQRRDDRAGRAARSTSSQADLDIAEQDLIAARQRRPTSTCSPRRTRWRRRAPARPRSPSSSPRPSATSRSAPRRSPTRARRRRASTSRRRRRSPPRTTCVTKRIALDQLVGRSNVEPRQLAVPVALPPPRPARSTTGSAAPTTSTRRCAGAPSRSTSPSSRPRRRAPQPAHRRRGRRRVGSGGRGTIAGRALTRPQHQRRASASRSTCRSSPATRSRTASRKRWCSRSKSRNDLECARRTRRRRRRARPIYGCSRARRRSRRSKQPKSSSQLALEATQLGYRSACASTSTC